MKEPISLITAKLNGFAIGFFLLLPNLLAAAIFRAVAWLIANLVAKSIARLSARRHRPDLGSLAVRDHGIDLPFPTQVMLFHDQSEATDGNRRHQREGWPAGGNRPLPRVPAKADAADE